MRFGLLLILFYLLPEVLFSQGNVKKYNIEHGLSSNTVYSSMNDSKGYMWFGTDKGVSRFNGDNFSNYTVSDGLTDNEVFNIFEDSQGRIWFATFNGQLCYYYNGDIFNSSNSTLPFLENNSYFNSIQEDIDGNIYFQSYQNGIFVYKKDGSVSRFLEGSRIIGLHAYNNNFTILAKINDDFKLYKFSSPNSLKEVQNKLLKVLYTPINIQATSLSKKGLLIVLHNFENSFNKFLVVDSINYNEKQNLLDAENVYFIKHRDGYYQLGTSNGYYTIDDSTFELTSSILNKKNISSKCTDFEGGTWFTSLHNGVFYLKNESSSAILKGNFSNLLLENDTIIAGGIGKIITHDLKSNNIINIDIPKNKGETQLLKVVKRIGKNKILLATGNSTLVFEKNEFKPINQLAGVKDLYVDKDNQEIYFATSSGLIIKPSNSLNSKVKTIKVFDKKRINSVTKYNGKIIVGTNLGLSTFNNDQFLPKITSRITDIESDSNILLVGSAKSGGYIIKNDSIIYHLEKSDGISVLNINKVHIYDRNNFMFASDNGIFQVKLDEKGLTINHFFSGVIVQDFVLKQDTCYIATPDGIFIKTLTRNKNVIPPQINVYEFLVNSVETKIEAPIKLKYFQNNIEVGVDGVLYSTKGNITYEYLLSPLNTNWVKTNSNILSFYNLPPNDYTLNIRCKSFNSNYSSIVRIDFQIEPPFYNTIKFYVFCIFSILILLILFFYLYKKRVNEKANINYQISELRQKALRAQINPHFLFNALNCIQHFFLSKNEFEGQKYLSKFAKLVRLTLNNSDKSFITLKEELELIDLYVDIELIRSDIKFKFNNSVNPNVDIYNEEIPSMIIQPIIENAIWHGIKGIENGVIDLIIDKEGSNIIIIIKDNGTGFIPKFEKKSNPSGLQLINDRISTINQLRKHKINVHYSINNGTIVKIVIPNVNHGN